uniref:Uncharacterized protein n=1 Tax=mine drainage metagenome TaxID=410659 RepID=E6QRD3_9ZZZZ
MKLMHLFSLQHSRFAYRADLILYGIVSLATLLFIAGSRNQWSGMLGFALTSLTSCPLRKPSVHPLTESL